MKVLQRVNDEKFLGKTNHHILKFEKIFKFFSKLRVLWWRANY